MKFTETRLKGCFIVDLEPREDSRGYFARAFCQREFREHGLNTLVDQVNVGSNRLKGIIRGMHFQAPPHGESKYVRATRGAILDVAVDLRPESDTYLQHVAVELSSESGRGLYLPERFAHGYQALEDGAEMIYFASTPYAPGFDGGLSPFDPALGIAWPLPVSEISPKDRDARPLAEIGDELKKRMSARGDAR